MNSKITNSSYASTSTSLHPRRGEAHLFPGVGMVMIGNCVIDHKGRKFNSPSECLIFLMREQSGLNIDPQATSSQNAPALPETSGQRHILRAARQGALIPRCGVGGSRLNRVRNLPR